MPDERRHAEEAPLSQQESRLSQSLGPPSRYITAGGIGALASAPFDLAQKGVDATMKADLLRQAGQEGALPNPFSSNAGVSGMYDRAWKAAPHSTAEALSGAGKRLIPGALVGGAFLAGSDLLRGPRSEEEEREDRQNEGEPRDFVRWAQRGSLGGAGASVGRDLYKNLQGADEAFSQASIRPKDMGDYWRHMVENEGLDPEAGFDELARAHKNADFSNVRFDPDLVQEKVNNTVMMEAQRAADRGEKISDSIGAKKVMQQSADDLANHIDEQVAGRVLKDGAPDAIKNMRPTKSVLKRALGMGLGGAALGAGAYALTQLDDSSPSRATT